jgi:hypothetical protein
MRNSASWAYGLIAFAGIMLVMIGMFQAINGLVAIFNDTFFLPVGDYWLEFDITAWGWIHLILGILTVVAGYGLLAGQSWARIYAIVIAVVVAVENFAFVPYYPFWSILMIALCVLVIWALATHGRDLAE